MGWETIASREVNFTARYSKDVEIYVSYTVDSSRPEAILTYYNGGSKSIQVVGSPLPTGTKVRAYFNGTFNTINKSVATSERIIPLDTSINPALVGKTNDEYGSTVKGTLYIEKYVVSTPTPPSTPSSITVPTTLEGGNSYSISWGSGSGATSYRLERSSNGGSYTQIYSGSSLSYTDTMSTNWNTVIYRVRAYNSGGYSSYRTSPSRTVIQNTAPTTPSNITVPELKGGKPATISWDVSTDADGDTIDYYLERSINGGEYSVIRSGGTSRSYSDTPDKSWNTVEYRVRAYDGKTYSSYKTSSTTTVKHFPEMKIRVDGALKTSEDGLVKIDGVLRKIDSIWTRIDGVLKEV